MESYSPIIVLIVNVLRTLLVKKAMDIFLSLDDVEKKSLKIGLGVYCMLTTIVYSMFQVSVVYEICNCLGMITLTCFYQEIWKKRLWVSLVLFSLDMACSLIVLFIFGELAEFQQPAIQALLILICVTVISHISYGVGNEHKWEKRWNISDKLTRNPIVSIPNEIVPTDGKNLRYRQLESIAKSFGIHNAILPRAEIGGNIQEMVDNRNYIAHGNKTPKEVGREVSVNDLQRKLDHISEACAYIIELYEKYIEEQMYLKNH